MHGKAFVKHNNQPRKLLFDIKRSLLTCHKFTIVILNKIFKISEQCTLISVHSKTKSSVRGITFWQQK